MRSRARNVSHADAVAHFDPASAIDDEALPGFDTRLIQAARMTYEENYAHLYGNEVQTLRNVVFS